MNVEMKRPWDDHFKHPEDAFLDWIADADVSNALKSFVREMPSAERKELISIMSGMVQSGADQVHSAIKEVNEDSGFRVEFNPEDELESAFYAIMCNDPGTLKEYQFAVVGDLNPHPRERAKRIVDALNCNGQLDSAIAEVERLKSELEDCDLLLGNSWQAILRSGNGVSTVEDMLRSQCAKLSGDVAIAEDDIAKLKKLLRSAREMSNDRRTRIAVEQQEIWRLRESEAELVEVTREARKLKELGIQIEAWFSDADINECDRIEALIDAVLAKHPEAKAVES